MTDKNDCEVMTAIMPPAAPMSVRPSFCPKFREKSCRRRDNMSCDIPEERTKAIVAKTGRKVGHKKGRTELKDSEGKVERFVSP